MTGSRRILRCVAGILWLHLTSACSETLPPVAPGDGSVDTGHRDSLAPAIDGGQSSRDHSLQALDARTAKGPLRAGAAVVDVTPKGKGVPLAGFGEAPRHQLTLQNGPSHLAAAFGKCFDPTPGDVAALFAPSEGVLDALTAKALVLDTGSTKVAFVKVDTVAVSRKLRDDLEAAALTIGIPKEHLVVTATHTHSGPGALTEQVLWELAATDCYHDKTYQEMKNAIVQALLRADQQLAPAAIGMGVTEERRVSKGRSGRPENIDPQVGVIKVVDGASGATIATLVNFAVHGTCLDAKNMKFSGDLLGYVERGVEAEVGGIALFINGAEGDVGPQKEGLEAAKSLGGLLAQTAAALFKQLPTSGTLEVAGAYGDVEMPKAVTLGCEYMLGSVCKLLGDAQLPIDSLMQHTLPFGALRLDNVAIVTVPGEATTDVGRALHQLGQDRGFAHTFIFGLANEHMGYVVTAAEYKQKTFEAQVTMYGEKTGDVVIEALAKRLDELSKAP